MPENEHAYAATVGLGKKAHAVVLAEKLPPAADRAQVTYRTLCRLLTRGELVYLVPFNRAGTRCCRNCTRQLHEMNRGRVLLTSVGLPSSPPIAY